MHSGRPRKPKHKKTMRERVSTYMRSSRCSCPRGRSSLAAHSQAATATVHGRCSSIDDGHCTPLAASAAQALRLV